MNRDSKDNEITLYFTFGKGNFSQLWKIRIAIQSTFLSSAHSPPILPLGVILSYFDHIWLNSISFKHHRKCFVIMETVLLWFCPIFLIQAWFVCIPGCDWLLKWYFGECAFAAMYDACSKTHRFTVEQGGIQVPLNWMISMMLTIGWSLYLMLVYTCCITAENLAAVYRGIIWPALYTGVNSWISQSCLR